MTPDTLQIVTTRFAQLPDVLAKPLTDGSIRGSVEAVGLVYDLTQQQQSMLEDEIVLTFLGLELISTLKERVRKNAVITQDIIDSLFEDLTLTIFTPEVIDELVGIEQYYAQLEAGAAPAESEAAQTQSFIPTSVANADAAATAVPQGAAETDAAAPASDEEEVKPLRTMEEDMDKIHGYGAYRKMYPDAESGEDGTATAKERPVTSTDQVHKATSQDEVLNKRPPLTGTPNYDQPPQQ